jgi:hypothetical protein
MIGMKGSIASMVVLLASGAALAGEESFAISCSDTPQAQFDKAVSMIGGAEAAALFQEMARRDDDCAILLWGVAMTASDPSQRRAAKREAILSAAINAASAVEWQKISALPDQ